jgi:hypothetical protein
MNYVVPLRGGLDAGGGGTQGPLDEGGPFDFVGIPDNQRVSVPSYR